MHVGAMLTNNIKELRIEFLLSPREFARLIGIYPDYIARLESGNRPLSDVWIDAIAKALGVPPEAVTDPGADIKSIAANAIRPPERPPVLCPIAARYAILSLVAKLGGLSRAEMLDEDGIADAVQNLVAYVDDQTPNLPGDQKDEIRANRLLRGLQISALTILQYHEAELPPSSQDDMEIALQGAVSLLEAFSKIDETAHVPGI